MVFSQILDPVFMPIFRLPILFAVIIVSFVLSLIMVLAYKFFTNQSLMKSMKDDLKKYQAQMKEHRNDTSKMMKVQKQAMDVNMKYMMHSFKPTLFTFIPIIIIFGWLNAHLAFAPIIPGEEFTTSVIFNEGVTGEATINPPEGIDVIGNKTQQITGNSVSWKLKGNEGEYLLDYKINENEYTKDVLITQEQKYAPPVQPVNNGLVSAIHVDQSKLIVLNLFGWKIGWFGSYFIFTLVFSMLLRKLLNIY